MYLTGLLSIWSLITASSTMAHPDKLSVLLCKNQCKSYGGCTSVLFDSKHLQCELIFGSDAVDTGKTGIRLFKVQGGKSTSGCGQKERRFNTRRGFPKCVKVTSKTPCKRIREKKKPCRKSATVNTPAEGPRCILLRRENITVRFSLQEIKLHMKLKPGMKMIVYGGSAGTAETSHLTIATDPENPTNPLKWFHINLKWNSRVLDFSQLFTTKTYNGDFPISDRSHFTLAFEVTQSDIKIYADKVPVKTIDFFPGLREFNIRSYSSIHALVVQKTGEECENVNNGIP